jgi:CheY-like chemotaxis protein
VTVAKNGKEALDVLAGQSFDLVLMDVQMPVMDGHEATRIIREREQQTGEHIRIIAMTAAAMKGDRERCLTSGMDAYISKPIKADELYRTIFEQTGDGDRGQCTNGPVQNGPAPAASNPVVDFDAARDNVPGGEAVLKSLAGIFLDECPKLIRDLRSALAAVDKTAAQRAAHTLKSSARIMIAEELAELARQIEEFAGSDQLPAIPGCLPRLDDAAGRTCDCIRQWLAKRS